ncbi:LexA family protein [Limnohabitans sp.]
MKVAVAHYPQPVLISDRKVWLEMCGWKVPAGFASPAADHTRKRIDLNDHLIRNGDATYILKVRGDSMIDIGIYEGDALLIDRSIEPQHGNIVLAVINSEFTVKRLHRRGGVIKLVPENKRYPTIVVKEEEDFSIWGVVTYNLHKLY